MNTKKEIERICKDCGCTLDDWNKTVEMLCKAGIAEVAFQDYGLLSKVIDYLTPHE